MSNDKAGEARNGLLDSVAGKAKEVAGAVTGRDDLVEEGQLQQAEARNRREAVAEEAVADAKRHEVVDELRETDREAAEQQAAARAEAAQEKSEVEQQRAVEHAAAEREGDVQEAEGRRAAERQAEQVAESRLQDAEAMATQARTTEQQAATDRRRLEHEAIAADQQAAQLRAETES